MAARAARRPARGAARRARGDRHLLRRRHSAGARAAGRPHPPARRRRPSPGSQPDGVPLADHRGMAALAVDRPRRRAHAQRAPRLRRHLRLARRRRDPGLLERALRRWPSRAASCAPVGADPDADLTAWKQRVDRGEPYGADARAILNKIHAYHGVLGLPIDKGITPLLVQSGWTDDLFPVGQGLRIYDLLRQKSKTAPVALQLGDLGHSRAANHPADIAAFNAQGLAFFDARLKRVGTSARARQRDRLHPDVPEDGHPRRRSVPRVVVRVVVSRAGRVPPQGRPARDLQRRRRSALPEALAAGPRPVQGRLRRRRPRHGHRHRALARASPCWA